MTKGHLITEFCENTARVFRSVGTQQSVMQMDLNFSPTGVAMLGEHLKQTFFVLLGRIKISVDEWAAIMVPPAVDDFGIFTGPIFETAFLLGERDTLLAIGGIDGRFEMIGHSKNDMHRTAYRRFQCPPCRRWHNFSCVRDFVFETHLKS